MKLIGFFLLFSFCSLFGNDVVIELLVKDHDNKLWQTKNQMPMRIGHIKDVDDTKLLKAIEVFNSENINLLQKSVNW